MLGTAPVGGVWPGGHGASHPAAGAVLHNYSTVQYSKV